MQSDNLVMKSTNDKSGRTSLRFMKNISCLINCIAVYIKDEDQFTYSATSYKTLREEYNVSIYKMKISLHTVPHHIKHLEKNTMLAYTR